MFSIRHLTKEEFARRWEASREKYYRLAYCYTKNEPDALEILSEATYRAIVLFIRSVSLNTLIPGSAESLFMSHTGF